jgi:CBS domain containing-hemolysin-like protein
MLTNPLVVVAVTTALIVASGFFVVIEFALLGARRHRLEELAATSASARAALAGSHELTVMLAGAQLGITACTFALGAVTKPAVDRAILPWFEPWLPDWAADVVAFVLALLFVTFLHLVLGEMAPKSWAITFPERAALLVGRPARAFVRPLRPLLTWINDLANRLVRASGVTPVQRAEGGGRDPDTLRHLIEHSVRVGALDPEFHPPLAGAIGLESVTMGELVDRRRPVVMVPSDATVADVQALSARTGHMRILVADPQTPPDRGGSGGQVRVVHVRDTLLEDARQPVSGLSRPAQLVEQDLPLHEGLAAMKAAREQLAVVVDGDRQVGVVTVQDILTRVVPGSAA